MKDAHTTTTIQIDSAELDTARQLAHLLDDNHAEDIVVLSVGEWSGYTDFLYICTARNGALARSLADKTMDFAHHHKMQVLGCEGEVGHEWTLVDLGDAVIHIFLPDARRFYNLEELWLDAPRVAIPVRTGTDAPSS